VILVYGGILTIDGTLSLGEFVAFYLSDGRVVGGVSVNVWDVNEHVAEVVRSGAPVDVARLTDLDVAPEEWAEGA